MRKRFTIDEIITSSGSEWQITDSATGYVYAVLYSREFAEQVCALAEKSNWRYKE